MCILYGECGSSPDQIVVCGYEHVELQQAARSALVVPLVSAVQKHQTGYGGERERESEGVEGKGRVKGNESKT